MVESPTLRSGSGRVAIPEVREWSGHPNGGLGVVGSGRETLTEVREWTGVVGRPPESLGVVRWHSRRFGIGWETLPEVREWSRVVMRPSRRFGSGRKAPGGPRVVEMLSLRSGSGRETILVVRVWS